MEFLKRLWNDEEGQGMVEYGLIIALVSIVVISLLALMGDGLRDTFNDIQNALNGTETALPAE